MISRSWFGVKRPKRASEYKLLGLLPPMFRPEAPFAAIADSRGADREQDGEFGGELGWTVGLCRGHDLPRLRLSMVPQPGERMVLRFDCCRAANLAETPNDGH
jgi:hypothetical protein